jgi:hypothetical protein
MESHSPFICTTFVDIVRPMKLDYASVKSNKKLDDDELLLLSLIMQGNFPQMSSVLMSKSCSLLQMHRLKPVSILSLFLLPLKMNLSPHCLQRMVTFTRVSDAAINSSVVNGTF